MIVTGQWSKEDISKWLLETESTRDAIELSYNGGVSWVKYAQHGKASTMHDVDRIYAMVKGSVLARDVNKRKKVTVTQDQVTTLNQSGSSFFQAVAKAQNIKHSQDHVNVYRSDGGGYWFSPLPLEVFRGSQPTAVRISQVTRTTYYDASTPNTNEVDLVDKVIKDRPPRAHGFVFRLMPANTDSHISHWWPVLQVSNPLFDQDEWTSVRCARVYDLDLDELFVDIGPIWSVIGGKYIWGWQKRTKLGDTWIIPTVNKDTLVKRIASKGMAIEPTPTANAVVDRVITYEVDPKYIMGIRQQLEQLLQTGDKIAVNDNLFKVIEFRNKCVDELKELNKTIEVAREYLING